MEKAPLKAPLKGKTRGLRPPWKKGETGNPSGLKKGTLHLTTILKQQLQEIYEQTDPTDKVKKKLILGEWIMKSAIGQALKGNTKALNIILDRIDGKVPLPVDIPPDTNFNIGMPDSKKKAELLGIMMAKYDESAKKVSGKSPTDSKRASRDTKTGNREKR